MTSGARRKFDALVFEPKVFRKQMYCIEESTIEIVGLYGAPNWFDARDVVSPLSPSLRLWYTSTTVVLNLFAEGRQIQIYDLLVSRTKEILRRFNWHVFFLLQNEVCYTIY